MRRSRPPSISTADWLWSLGMISRHRVAEAARPRLQRLGELLYRAADGASRAAFRNEARALSAPIIVNGHTIDTIEDIAEFTGLGREVVRAEIASRRLLNFRSEWFATPSRIRHDHWFYLSSKTYLFANASHFTDGEFVGALRARIEPGAEVLDFGGGSGELTLQLVASGYHVSFVELNSLQRDFMRFRIVRHDLQGAIDVLEPWTDTPQGAFDAVVAMDVIEHLPNAAEVLRDRLLPARKPSGVLVENSPFVVNPGNPMHHEDFGFEEFMSSHGLVEAEPVGPARVWVDGVTSTTAS